MSNGERSSSVEGGDYAECPFTISYSTDPSAAAKKRKRENYDGTRFKLAKSPFSQTGGPVTDNLMNLYYTVEPEKQWQDLGKFSSFLLNEVNYPVKSFIKVANKATVEQQKSRSNQETNNTEPGDYWVAYILEIRASDKHHVYILVYWMYWPDELPAGARIGRKVVQGRQPYHGANELIASNCMDVINAASVTGPAIVEQLIESNNEEPVRRWCKCQSYANPDEIFIGCTNPGCMEWMHLKCMVHDILVKVYEQRVNIGQRPEGGTHPLSTIDTKGREVQHLIDICPKETRAGNHTRMDVRETIVKTETSTPMLTSFKYKKGRKKEAAGPKPYEGLFEADLKTQCSPPVWEIRDLRKNGGAEDGKSTEAVHCLQCGVLVM
ncbi:hypothetical protein FPRO04_12228 [Fusarium proliferatum]|nr:hypothetical protein FPRO04_12228 [Fusarium proliferatum]